MKINKELIKYILAGLGVTGLIMLGIIAGMFFYEPERNIIISDTLRDYVIEHNLEMDNFNEITNKWDSDLNLSSFHASIKNNFVYDDLKDCKYWSLKWALYFEKHNYNYKYVLTGGDGERFNREHIFVIMYTKDGYYIADQRTLEFFGLENE